MPKIIIPTDNSSNAYSVFTENLNNNLRNSSHCDTPETKRKSGDFSPSPTSSVMQSSLYEAYFSSSNWAQSNDELNPSLQNQAASEKIVDCINSQSSTLNLSDTALTSAELSNLLAHYGDDLLHVTILRLGLNQLDKIPKNLCKLKQLQVLNLGDNKLRSLPSDIRKLKQLRQLNLRKNEFAELPDALWTLSSLTRLNLGENKSLKISGQVSKLTNLQELTLLGCDLNNVPNDIAKLRNLEKLYLANNALTSIPDSIGKLSQLSRLDLSNNRIESLPPAIVNLKNDCIISLDGNHQTLPSSTFTRMQEAIVTRRLDDPTRGPELEMNNDVTEEHFSRPLLAEISSWHDEIGVPLTNESISKWRVLSNTTDGAQAFSDQLGRMRHTAHYQHYPNDIKQRVVNALNKLQDMPDAAGACFAQAIEGIESCDDRIALAFVFIEETILLHEALHANTSPKQLIETAKKLFRSKNLQALAFEKAGNAPDSVDPTALVLRYWVELSKSDALDLPSKISEIIFVNLAGTVTQRDIDDVKNQILALENGNEFSEYLGTWEPWQTFLKKETPAEFSSALLSIDQKKNDYHAMLSTALDDESADQITLVNTEKLRLEFNKIAPCAMGALSRKVMGNLGLQ